jgi:uncharacterized surface anchored protein/endonuclease YncB( thermonuclease family)
MKATGNRGVMSMTKNDTTTAHEKHRARRLMRAALSTLLVIILLPTQAFADIGTGTPPSSISGIFNLRAQEPVIWTEADGSTHYGSVTVNQGYDVASFPGFFYCTSGSGDNAWNNLNSYNPSPNTTTWGTWTASHASNDEANGIAYYWVGPNQVLPAGVSNWSSLQNLGNQTIGVRWSFVKGTINLQKSSADPGITGGNPCYSLAGAVYDVHTEGGAWAGSITTDEQGKGSLGGIELGTYTVRESKASAGYGLDPNTYTVTTSAGSPVQTVQSPEPPRGDPLLVILQKVDAETGGSYGAAELPQGSAKLEGAEYTVRYYAGLYATVAAAQAVAPTRTWVIGTDSDGWASLDSTYIEGDPLYYSIAGNPLIPFGTVTVTETKAPEGYRLPQPGDADYKVFLTRYVPDASAPNGVRIEGDGNGIQQGNEPKSHEPVVRGDIELTKLMRMHGPDSVELTGQDVPEAGAVFDFYASRDFSGTVPNSGAAPAFTLTTDAAGRASTVAADIYLVQNQDGSYTVTARPTGTAGGLPYDSYLCVQRAGDPAYAFAAPFVFSVSANGTVQAQTFYDLPVAASIEVIKCDAETGAQIAWPATWQIWSNQTGGYVQMWVAGKQTDTFNSDAAGRLVLPEQLPYGSYRLHEVAAPGNSVTGYVLSSADVPFTVERDYSIASPLVVEMADTPAKGTIALTKTGARDSRPVAAAEYAVIADGDIRTLDGTLRAADGDVVATLVTDAQGKAASDPLHLGSYIVKETAAPDGYLQDLKEYEVELAYKDQHTALVKKTLELVDKEIVVEVEKSDKGTHKPLAGAEFTLYRESAPGAGDWAEVGARATDEKSKAVFFPILKGSYRLVETKAPDGYMLPSEAGFADERLFAADGSSAVPVIRFSFEDYAKPLPGILKLDADTDAPLGGAGFTLYRYPVAIKNGLIADDVSLIAADDLAWEEVTSVTTDAEGKAVLPGLAFGYYQLVETKAPDGYMLPSEAGFPNEQTFRLESKTPLPLTITVKDYAKPSPEVLKLDADTDAPLGGAGFTLYRYPTALEDGHVVTDVSLIAAGDLAWEEVTSVTTDAEGKAVLPKLAFGYYQLVETKAPDGYMLPSEAGFANERPFKLERITPLPLTITVKDYVKPAPEVLKLDADTDKPLGGADFTLYRYPATVEDGLVTTDIAAIAADDPAWEEIASVTTGTDGKAALPKLAFGYYQLVETRAPSGYMLPSEAGFPNEHPFKLESDTLYPLTITVKDYTKPVPEVLKLDADTHMPVADTEFTLYRYPVTVKDGLVTTDISAITADDPAWAEVARVTTDAEGKAVLPQLVFGYYQLKESRPNPLYATYEESGGGDRFFALTKHTTLETQVFEDDIIQVSCEVYKHTIAVTSSALDGAELDAANNVGQEEYLYHFGARSNATVWADEFVVTDSMLDTTMRGYRMTTLWTGTVPEGLDFDGRCTVLYRTNMAADNDIPDFTYNLMAKNPENPNNPDRRMAYSNQGGWQIWAEGISATEQSRLDVSALGLAPGEYITGLKVAYGGVDVGFYTGSRYGSDSPVNGLGPLATATAKDWSYAVMATEALLPYDRWGNETVIYGDVSADIARNTVLTDDDTDAVETRVIAPFEVVGESNGVIGGTPGITQASDLPRTGDVSNAAMLVVCLLALGLAACVACLRRRRRIKGRGVAALVLMPLLVLALAAGCGTVSTAEHPNGTVTVSEVIDGDTLRVDDDGQVEKVRLIGVDTPEMDDERFSDEAEQAKLYTQALVEGKDVWLETEAVNEYDRYGRTLGYIWLTEPPQEKTGPFIDNTLNGRLVRDGFAEVMAIEPNTTYKGILKDAEERAKADSAGLWPTGVFNQ